MTEALDLMIEGLATAIPIILTSFIILYRFKNELCKQITDLRIQVETHIKISESQMNDLEKTKEKLTNIILKNNLTY